MRRLAPPILVLTIMATACGGDATATTTTPSSTRPEPTEVSVPAGVERDDGCVDHAITVPTDYQVLWLSTGNGNVTVEGHPRPEIEARAVACGPDQATLEGLRFEVTLRSEGLVIIGAGVGSGEGTFDVDLKVPDRMFVDLDLASGDVELSGVDSASTTNNGTGAVEIRDIAGDLLVNDGKGPLRIARIGGTVEIEEDQGGGLVIQDVGGDVELVIAQGDITIDGVAGDLVNWYDTPVVVTNLAGEVTSPLG